MSLRSALMRMILPPVAMMYSIISLNLWRMAGRFLLTSVLALRRCQRLWSASSRSSHAPCKLSISSSSLATFSKESLHRISPKTPPNSSASRSFIFISERRLACSLFKVWRWVRLRVLPPLY